MRFLWRNRDEDQSNDGEDGDTEDEHLLPARMLVLRLMDATPIGAAEIMLVHSDSPVGFPATGAYRPDRRSGR